MNVFHISKPANVQLPIVLSVPHAGTYFPAEIQAELKQDKLPPDDIDWHVNQLYNFADSSGIIMITAQYSRWVIDLNRNPDSTPLYNDGRIITALCPATNFLGEAIYTDERKQVAMEEVSRRRKLYFDPYHTALQRLLNEVKAQFGSVLLWDCHSIRRFVPAIHPEPFPDLIIGSADRSSASDDITDKALNILGKSNYSISHNYPFKGGYITRHFGKPNKQQHALQLEMAKPLYLDDSEQVYDSERAEKVRTLLTETLTALGNSLL